MSVQSRFNINAQDNKTIVKNLSDDDLLDLVQRQTLRYFWDLGHPVSGMARDRNQDLAHTTYITTVRADGTTFISLPDRDPNSLVPVMQSADIVSTSGTGFGIMAMIAGAERGWLPKQDVQDRVAYIVDFLECKADKFYGVFPHFMDGATGDVACLIPNDDGSDLVETGFLMMGLLAAREYFTAKTPEADALRKSITKLYESVEWNWHTPYQNDELYWHWSPKNKWLMRYPIQGWNECLITQILAVASPTHPISRTIYDKAWAGGKDFKNGKSYTFIDPSGPGKTTTITQPLGPEMGGPLFFTHYSFMGLDPRGLKDKYADYWEQNLSHVLINHAYCVENPKGYVGYGPDCWGLTASDDHIFYGAHCPTDDLGVITPTAALSSFPYTPEYSMKALRHFYEDMGDRLWTDTGFIDAFNESKNWYAKSQLAIDQAPIVVMIENHRSGLLWNLVMNCPEIKRGLKMLDFESPYLQPKPVLMTAAPSP
jgi:hypothetical protein